MGDRYRSFTELVGHEQIDRDFRVVHRATGSPVLVLAPHGGAIEPGTSEIATVIAGEDFGFYAFEGIKPCGNWSLHLKSTHFDEPRALSMVSVAETVVVVHGCAATGGVVFLGGRADKLAADIGAALQRAGFATARHDDPALRGRHTLNICNRGRTGAGVQLEVSRGLRTKIASRLSQNDHASGTSWLETFAIAVRAVLGNHR